jgi:hypothetical protein
VPVRVKPNRARRDERAHVYARDALFAGARFARTSENLRKSVEVAI